MLPRSRSVDAPLVQAEQGFVHEISL